MKQLPNTRDQLKKHNIDGENYYCENDLKAYLEGVFKQFANSLSDTFNEKLNFQEEIFTVKEAAEFHKVDPQTIHNWKDDGKLMYCRRGGRVFFLKSDIIDSLEKIQN